MNRSAIACALLALSLSAPANAHGGGLDSEGCHTERATGERHCHGGGDADDDDAADEGCCRVCVRGKACGDACISRDYQCHQPPGCACDSDTARP